MKKRLKRNITVITLITALLIALVPQAVLADGAQTIVIPDDYGVTNPAASIELVNPAEDSWFYIYSYNGTGTPVFDENYNHYEHRHTVTFKLTGVDPTRPCDDNLAVFSGNECDVKTESCDTTGGDIRTCTVVQGGFGGPAPYVAVTSSNQRVEFMVYNLFVPSSIKLNKYSATVSVGRMTNLTASQKVVWTSDNETVAKVNQFGMVQGLADGVANITATYEGYGLTLTATCVITVGSGVMDPCADGHTASSVKGSKPTYTKTGLTDGKVCSVCGKVLKAQKVIPVKALAKPAIKAVSPVSDGLKITWSQVTGATGYRIYKGSKLIKTITGSSTCSYVDTDVANASSCSYKVTAIAKSGTKVVNVSDQSGVKKAVYLVTPTIKTAANSQAKAIKVSWSKNSKASGYMLKYVKGKTTKTIKIAKASQTSDTIKNLSKGASYKIYVRSYKTVNSVNYYSAWSSGRSVKIMK